MPVRRSHRAETPDAGFLFAADRLPSLHVSLSVARAQFLDILPRLEAGRLKDFQFAVEPKIDEIWPISSWGCRRKRAVKRLIEGCESFFQTRVPEAERMADARRLRKSGCR